MGIIIGMLRFKYPHATCTASAVKGKSYLTQRSILYYTPATAVIISFARAQQRRRVCTDRVKKSITPIICKLNLYFYSRKCKQNPTFILS
jgi:hypothetical protein